jgi:peptidoglycan/xylan/chitin deacetylase (PgdA/CDA1 family)
MDMSRAGLPILMYHAIEAAESVISTGRSWFIATLDALAAADYRAVDLSDWVAQGRPDVKRAFALTFDDGLRSILDVADELSQRRIPATVFLVSGRMGGDNGWPGQPRMIPRAPLLAWSDLDALATAGFQFGAHGQTHRRFDQCDDQALENELRGSRDAIEQKLGRPCPLLAYPYGLATERVRRAAARHFDAAVGTRLDLATAHDDAFDLARIDSHYLRSHGALERLLADRARAWLQGRRVLRAARGAWTLSRTARDGQNYLYRT